MASRLTHTLTPLFLGSGDPEGQGAARSGGSSQEFSLSFSLYLSHNASLGVLLLLDRLSLSNPKETEFTIRLQPPQRWDYRPEFPTPLTWSPL